MSSNVCRRGASAFDTGESHKIVAKASIDSTLCAFFENDGSVFDSGSFIIILYIIVYKVKKDLFSAPSVITDVDDDWPGKGLDRYVPYSYPVLCHPLW